MLLSELDRKYRRDICNLCPKKRGDFKILGITIFKRKPQCSVCKCLINLKTSFIDSECPIGRW